MIQEQKTSDSNDSFIKTSHMSPPTGNKVTCSKNKDAPLFSFILHFKSCTFLILSLTFIFPMKSFVK